MTVGIETGKFISKVTTIAVTAVVTFLFSYSITGMNAITKADAQAMIEKAEAQHEAKIDLVLSKLTEMEVEQAKLEAQLEDMKEANVRAH